MTTPLRRPELSIETVVLLGAIYLASSANAIYWSTAFAGRSLLDAASLRFAAATFVLLAALHFIGIGLLATRHTLRPLLALLIVASSLGAHFMQQYGIVFDPSMLRNVLRTDAAEAADLINVSVVVALLQGIAIAALLWAVTLKPHSLLRALSRRGIALGAALLVAGLALMVGYKDLASQMRNDRALRYTILPANLIWSAARVAVGDARAAALPRLPLEPAVRAVPARSGAKPLLLVMVVGETARAANFSLNGYARPTNPQLAQLALLNFPNVTACGTSTEVSLPCIFSPQGRADYDEAAIRRGESLVQLLTRVGLRVVWLDNQSGCKGVCDGVEYHHAVEFSRPELCADGQCQDGILLHGLERVVRDAATDTVVVMHQIGNHGPAYFRRYPADMKQFVPACENRELRNCTREQIVNAYDNAIRYTDRVLAETIRYLDRQRDRFDVALIYASDHGESLGEHGLYLHGMPYALAPREQLAVPMIWWMPETTARRLDFDLACLRGKAGRAQSHDNLYHSMLGMLNVRTPRYRPERDLTLSCRGVTLAHAPGAEESAPRLRPEDLRK